MNWISFSLLLFLSLPEKAELEKAVATYWDDLMKPDKNSALRFVLPESRNAFILRREPFFRSWKLVGIEPKLEQDGTPSAAVTVLIEKMMEGAPGNFFNLEVKELWIFGEGNWKVRVEKVTPETFLRPFQRTIPQPSKPNTLQVLPKQLKIHFLSAEQQGSIVVRNGLEAPAQVIRLEHDQQKFEVAELPVEVKPGETVRLTIRYKGDEIAKDLKSQITLTLKQGGEESVYTIPVIYNYLSPGARGLFGLTEEKAQKLKRGDKLTPVIEIPKEEKSPETSRP